jgi:hypothetical protein
VGDEMNYLFQAVDPDNNPIRYYIEWGDGSIEDWCREYASNEEHYVAHIYNDVGTFTINAKAKDVFGEESGWGQFDVTVTERSRAISSSLLLCLLELYPLFNLLFQRLRI